MIFLGENSSELGIFWSRQGLQANHGTVSKSAIFSQSAIQNGLNEAILPVRTKEAYMYFQDKILCLPSNQDLILYEGDSNF